MERLTTLRHWANQAQTLQQVIAQSTVIVDEGLAKIRLSTALEDKRAVAGLNGEVARARTTALHAEKLLLGMTRTDNLSAAAALLLDVAVGLDQAGDAYLKWRMMRGTAQLLVATGALADAETNPENLPTYDGQARVVESARLLFELAVKQVLAMLPEGAAEEVLR